MRQERLVQVAQNEIEIHENPRPQYIDLEDYLYEQHRDNTGNTEEQHQETPHAVTSSGGCPDQ